MGTSQPQSGPRSLLKILLGSFAVAFPLLFGAYLSVLHVPLRADSDRVQFLIGLLPLSSHRGWTVVHVLSGDCQCSQAVGAALALRPQSRLNSEVVVLANDRDGLATRLTQAGYTVSRWRRDELASRFHLRSVPVFLVLSPTRSVAYLGGYSAQRGPTATLRDREILAQISSGSAASPFPVFGCALSSRVRDQIDPLSLKISN